MNTAPLRVALPKRFPRHAADAASGRLAFRRQRGGDTTKSALPLLTVQRRVAPPVVSGILEWPPAGSGARKEGPDPPPE